jgi:DDE superfamily endonuclease/Archaeal putative transposase ISC1217
VWTMIPSLQSCVDTLAPTFTQPSFSTCCVLLTAWVMCLGKHTLLRVGHTSRPQAPPDNSRRHGLDRCYNFFERSAWRPEVLAQHVGLLVLKSLNITGLVTLLVDDTLTHKSGKSVWGLGWFRDAVASTKKRTATAPGHNWVVLAIAFHSPLTAKAVLALPLMARLHLPGKGNPSCASLAKEMLQEALAHLSGHRFTLVGDGAYACKELLKDLPRDVCFVGRVRSDAAVYDPVPKKAEKGKPGRKALKGPKLPKPKEAAQKADRKRVKTGAWVWQEVKVTAYGKERTLQAFSYRAVWPRVLGLRPIQVVVVRDKEGNMDDVYLFTTDLEASLEWVITKFAWRWAIEVLFRGGKQVMDVEAPQHFCRESVEKVVPWVLSLQSVLMVWYLTAGHQSKEALEIKSRMGPWDSEWSLRHMLQVLQAATLNATIDPDSDDRPQLLHLLQTLKNWALLAA